MASDIANNKRIAKNTLILYLRTFIVLLITLYTSRVILQVLGVDDYGLYNVVGGVVAMFSVISGSISTSISRFITFDLGRNDTNALKHTFSSSLTLLLVFALIIIILGEGIGVWFIQTQLTIPEGRLSAAHWIFQFSLITFALNIVGLAYDACIRAHERMSIFAYVSIIGTFLKLVICFMLYYSPFDKLVYYGILMLLVNVIVFAINYYYCNRNFIECQGVVLKVDKEQFKSLGSFAGWTSVMHGTYILNTQGINILMNIFFGVTVNAARGIAHSVESAIMGFVNNFLSAVYPQITKLYASGNTQEMNKLVCRSSKFAYFLLLILAMPVYIETDYILSLWLGVVPEHTVAFFRLTIIASALSAMGNSGNCACQATGNVKGFSSVMAMITVAVFPLTYIGFKIGLQVETAYVVYIIIYSTLIIVRMLFLKRLVGLLPILYIRLVLIPVMLVTTIASLLPFLIHNCLDSSFVRLLSVCIVSILTACMVIYLVGLTKGERMFIIGVVRKTLCKNHQQI